MDEVRYQALVMAYLRWVKREFGVSAQVEEVENLGNEPLNSGWPQIMRIRVRPETKARVWSTNCMERYS